MWMCTGQLGAYVPCPTSPLALTADALETEVRLLNGGSYVKPKSAGRRKYDIGWAGNIQTLQPVKNFYDGLYGDGPYYFIDPTSIYNAMPPHWAAPQLSGTKWPSLVAGVLPVISATSVAATATPPPLQATYTLPAVAPVFAKGTPKITLPIQPNMTLNLRFWGSRTGTAVVRINAYDRVTGTQSIADVTPSLTGTSASFAGTAYSYIEVWITKTSTVASTITLAASAAILSASAGIPSTWFGGQGNSGLQFVGELVTSTIRTYGSGWQSLTGSMVEVGTWTR